jgi:hypothetical protein
MVVKKTLKNFINPKYMLNEIININSNSVFDVAEVSVGQHYYWEIWLFCPRSGTYDDLVLFL